MPVGRMITPGTKFGALTVRLDPDFERKKREGKIKPPTREEEIFLLKGLQFLGDKMEREQCENSLIAFTRRAWREIGESREIAINWHHLRIAWQLIKVSRGQVRNLIVNIPPRHTKTILVNVMYPAWLWIQPEEKWGPMSGPHVKILSVSYGSILSEEIAVKMRRLVMGEWYQKHWGKQVKILADQQSRANFGNEAGGERMSSSIEGGVLGRGGDLVIYDDPQTRRGADSEMERAASIRGMSDLTTRITDPRTAARILITQRLHTNDATDWALRNWPEDTVHLMYPARFDPDRACRGDPRKERGELLWPEVWTDEGLRQIEQGLRALDGEHLSEYAIAGQLQQQPIPKGGGIVKAEWLEPWPPSMEDGSFPTDMVVNGRIQYPALEYVVAWVDTAFTEKEQNDRSAMMVFGVFRAEGKGQIERVGDGTYRRVADDYGFPKVLLLHGWAKRLELHGPPEVIPPGVTPEEWRSPRYREQRQASWGLVEWVIDTCRRYKVDHLGIETQGQGHGLEQELRRLFSNEPFGVELHPAIGDKWARANAVQGIFSSRQVYVPMYEDGTRPMWCDPLIEELCLAGETEIITRNGIKRIDMIDVGDQVLTHLGRFRPVLAVGERDANEVIRIEGKTLDPLCVTPEHPIYAVFLDQYRRANSPEWTLAGKIQPRSYRQVSRAGGTRHPMEATTDPAHAVLLPIVNPENEIDHLDLRNWAKLPSGRRYDFHEDAERMWTSSGRIRAVKWHQPLDFVFGRICGLYLAEGSTNRQQTSWSFNEKEIDFITEVQNFLRVRLGVGVSMHPSKGCMTVVANLPLLEGFFAEFGKRAKEKRIPEWMWDAPNEFVKGVLEGYCDGDGHRSRGGRVIDCVTVSKSLAWMLRLLSARIGIRATIHTRAHKPGTIIHGVEVKTTQTPYVFRWVTESDKGAAHVNIEDTFMAYSVMRCSVEDKARVVFNLHVAEDQSYCTTGGLVHNCLFPRGRHDDVMDATSAALRHLRDIGMFERREEFDRGEERSMQWTGNRRLAMPYDV